MRVLCFTQQFREPWSGLGTYARCLVHGLRDRGLEVVVGAPERQCDPDSGVPCRPMAFEPGNVTPFSRRRMGREFRRALAAVPEGLDVVHFLDAREAALIGEAPGLPPLVGSVHDAYALDWRAADHPRSLYDDRRLRGVYYAWLRRFERRAYRRLAGIAANSRYVADAVTAGYGLPEGRVRVVPLGLPEPPAVEPRDLPGDPSVLFVGAGFRRKGLPQLVQAVARLASRRPEILLHVVGKGRELEGPVRFHGHQGYETVRAFLAGADLVAVPSHVEAVGLVYLEALQSGTPVIGTARGGTPEYLTDGVDAILVPPGDVEALAAAVERLASDPGLRRRLADAGRETVRRFSAEAMVTGVERLYEDALES